MEEIEKKGQGSKKDAGRKHGNKIISNGREEKEDPKPKGGGAPHRQSAGSVSAAFLAPRGNFRHG